MVDESTADTYPGVESTKRPADLADSLAGLIAFEALILRKEAKEDCHAFIEHTL